MKEEQKYYLGIDMGTSSVGWAVTNPEYELLRAKGKDLWGVRLFSEAKTSAERRAFRISRRRRQREVARLGLLRELFAPAIDEVDPGFFARLDDSKYHMQERTESNKQPYALFADTGYTDVDYYKEFPTIFHLRKKLLETTEKQDVRLVYLALANLYKRRGHFLNESLSEENDEGKLEDEYLKLCEKAEEFSIELPRRIDCVILESKLGEKGISRKKVLENVSEFLGIKKSQKSAYQLISLMCGMTVKLIDVFGEEIIDEENKKTSLCFRANNYEELSGEIQSLIGDDNFELIALVKLIHDKGLLSNIMKGHTYLSQARVASYEEHKADLKQLKSVMKKYDSKAYHEMFRVMKEGNYSAYVGSVNSSDDVIRRIAKGKGRDDLYKTVRSILKDFPQDDAEVQRILERMDAEEFLPKQLTAENGVIPNQIHFREMSAILHNAENYLPFLKEKDETGLTTSEKILQIFKFRIPYYVGPLGQAYKDREGYNVWAERIAGGRIYPWNFEEKIDLKKSAEKFISRMVRHCTFLSGESALPKNSLLYEKFQVLNELNNLKVRGEKLEPEVKQDIYQKLFSKGKKVTLRTLTNYLEINGYMEKGEENVISGIDGGFQSSLTTIGKFYGIFGDSLYSYENQKMIEDIVFWGTVYGNDKKFLREKIQENYGSRIDEQQLKRILGFKFDGWGRLSKSFLEMEGASTEDGVVRSIIVALWETNDNLMELLSGRYTYKETLEDLVHNVEKPLSEWKIEDLNDLYLSAPVKRMVWQTLSIVKELETVIGNKPSRIFVEMAREDAEKNKRTVSRKQKLLELYKAIGKEANAWKKEVEDKQEADFRSRKLYLYYLQMGRCMYTGEAIDLDSLIRGEGYDIDHIYPRHFIKDDSLENNLVLVKKGENAHKSDSYPIEKDIRDKQKSWWKELYRKGFISEEKFHRLTRNTQFTEEEKAAFINRQLVETRQGTKVITQILQQAFPNVEIVFTKAGVVSDFRKKYELLKVRLLNNYHHAHDAYLNIVVGNTYFVKFTKNPLNFIREADRHPEKAEYKYNMDRIFDWNVIRNGESAWIAAREENAGTIKIVRKVLAKNSPLVTRYCAEKHGGITGKATIWDAKTAQGTGYIPVKMKDERLQDVTRYGGLTSVSASGYSLVEYKVKGKEVRSLEGIPIYLGRVTEIKEEDLLNYFIDVLQKENKGKEVSDVRICKKFIPSDSLIKYNGFYYYLGGKTNAGIYVKNAVELCFNNDIARYIKKIEKACGLSYYEEKDKNGKLIITKEMNERVYNLLKEKYTSSIYSKQLGVVGNLIREGEELFRKLEIEEQCYTLIQIIKNCQTGEFVDLRHIGGKEKSGKNKINKKLQNVESVLLINKSITGIYEAEVNLLTV